MPLKPYLRGETWWTKGRVEYNGRPISEYVRSSTGASTEQGARDWIECETDRQIRRHIVGDEDIPVSFADAVTLYDPTPEMAKALIPILSAIGNLPVRDVTPKMVRDLGPALYPDNATDTWRRWVISPTRAVINNAHDQLGGRCPPIKIAGYSREQRVAQDRARGKRSRIERVPGSWDWLLQFREHASPKLAALALTMFATGARVGQATAMHPGRHLDLQNARIAIPAAKGHDDRWLDIPMELVVELANLKTMWPMNWERTPDNMRVFGYAGKNGPRKAWHHACDLAGIAHIMPHAAGRHGFGQEMNVRQPIDEKAAGAFGGWADTRLMRETYTHAEDHAAKVHASFRTGLVQAETATGLKLLRTGT